MQMWPGERSPGVDAVGLRAGNLFIGSISSFFGRAAIRLMMASRCAIIGIRVPLIGIRVPLIGIRVPLIGIRAPCGHVMASPCAMP